MANDEIYLPSQHIWTPDQQKERDTRSFLTRIEGFEHLVNMHEMPDEIIFTGGGMHGSFQTGVLEALINTGVLQQNENAPRIHGTSVGACIAFLYASAEHRPGTFEDERNLKFFTDAMLKTGVIHKGWPPLNAGKLYYMLATHPKMNPDLLKQSPQPVLATVVAMDRSSAQERFTANIDLRTANDPVQVVLASCLMPRIFDDTDAIILKNEIDYFTGEIINGPCVDGGYGDYPIGIVPLLERTNGLDHPDKIKHILVVTGNPQDNKLAVDIRNSRA